MSNFELAPPHSFDAEQCLIGSMILDQDCIDDVIELVQSSEFFYFQDHALVFDAILQIFNNSNPVDVVTISEHLGGKVALHEIAAMVKNTPSARNATSYAGVVVERYKLRMVIDASQEAKESAYAVESVDDICAKLSASLEAIDGGDCDRSSANMAEIGLEALEEMERKHNSDSDLVGFSTGFIDVDKKTGGLCAGNLFILGGRPSMGKTAFSLNLVDHHLKNGGAGLMFSMEMSKVELYYRMLAANSGVSLGLIRQSKQMLDSQWAAVTAATARLKKYNFRIDEQSGLHLNQIRARCRAHKRRHGLDFVIIDYLTLMNLGSGEDRVNLIGEITKGLKIMARELDTCVILLTQLNRSLEKRPDKRPIMSDIRDSGAIEQDADVVAFMYRDEVYHPDTDQKGVAELILSKQRNAETGTVRLVFRGELQRFENYAAYLQS